MSAFWEKQPHMPIKAEIYENAKEIFFLVNPDCEITPTVEELKEGGYWEKARNEKKMNPETKYLVYGDKIEDEKYEQFMSNLKKKSSEYSSKTMEVEIDKIIPCPLLPRRSVGDLTPLAKSIRIVGLLAPLVLRKSKEKEGFYEIVCGYRRFEALKYDLYKKKVKAEVFDELSKELVFCYSASENHFHKRLSATEKADNYKRWKETTGWTNKMIADTLFLSGQEISNYLRLLTLPEEFKKLNAFNFLSLNLGLSILKIKDTKKQITIGKDFDKVLKEKPHLREKPYELNIEFTKIMKKHREETIKKTPIDGLTKLLLEDAKEMMTTTLLTRNACDAFARYFWDACLKANIFEGCYSEALHYVEQATKKKVADVSLDINLIKEEIVVDINSYREKDSGKWVPFELRFRSYRL